MSSLHYPNEVAIKLPDSVVDRSKTLSISNMAENQQSDENLIKAVKNDDMLNAQEALENGANVNSASRIYCIVSKSIFVEQN